MSRKYPVTKFRLPHLPPPLSLSLSLSLPTPLSEPSLHLSPNSLPLARFLEGALPRFSPGCVTIAAKGAALTGPSCSAVFSLSLPPPSFVSSPFSTAESSGGKSPLVSPHFSLRRAVGCQQNCWYNYFAALLFSLSLKRTQHCLVSAACSPNDSRDQNAEQHFILATLFPSFLQFL